MTQRIKAFSGLVPKMEAGLLPESGAQLIEPFIMSHSEFHSSLLSLKHRIVDTIVVAAVAGSDMLDIPVKAFVVFPDHPVASRLRELYCSCSRLAAVLQRTVVAAFHRQDELHCLQLHQCVMENYRWFLSQLSHLIGELD